MMSDLVKKSQQLKEPGSYFRGLDWKGELLPREIVSFCRTAQDHSIGGWQGISAKTGRYDQHSRYVLLVALEGSGRIGVEADICQVNEGDAHLLLPYQIHYYVELPKNFTWLYVTFDLEQTFNGWNNDGRSLSRRSRELLFDFIEKYENGEGLQASLTLGETLRELAGSEPVVRKVINEGDLVVKVKNHVMSHLEGDLALPVLANAMGVSESYLRAVFREETGVSVGNFVRSVRLLRATHLLERQNHDLGDVARKAGFASLTSFTRAFRRMYDLTPSAYRKRSKVEV